LILLGFWQLNYTWERRPLIGDIRLPFVIIGLALGYLAASFKSVKEDEYGVVSFFGLMIKTTDSRLIFVPFLLCRLIRLSTSQITIEIGGGEVGDSTAISQKNGSNFVRCPEPLMVTFADGKEIEGQPMPKGLLEWPGTKNHDEPFNRRLRASLKVTIVVRIAQAAAQQFIRRVHTFENAVEQLDKSARGVVDDTCTKITWAYFNHHQQDVADHLLANLEDFVGDPNFQDPTHLSHLSHPSHPSHHLGKVLRWGIDVISAAVQPSAFADNVQQAFDSVTAARETRIAVEETAKGARKKLEEEGEGTAYAEEKLLTAKATGRRKMLKAEADGLADLIAEYQKEPEIGGEILTLKAKENVAATAAHTIISDDILGPAAVRVMKAVDAASKQTQSQKGGTV
jgi:regulator of protease activity HflC (stomatin/prohibitin superfamily)